MDARTMERAGVGSSLSNPSPPRPDSLVTALERLNMVNDLLSSLIERGNGIATSMGGAIPTDKAAGGAKMYTEGALVPALNALAHSLQSKANELDESLSRISRAVG